MLEPISLGAIGAVLGAVGSGMANEAGRWAWESAGSLVRRITGREVPAPTTPDQRDEVARLVSEGLRQDPRLARTWTRFAHDVRLTAPPSPHAPTLPATPRSFTDRRPALRLLDREADRPYEGRPRIVLVHGPEGIGTTTLAAHWGWRRADRFPDGRHYVDLGALTAEAALRTVLVRLGVPDEEIPPAADDRAALLRRCLAGRRLLLVLDHVGSAAQVSALVTAEPGVVTLVVATQPLAGLDALRVPVGPLARRDAVRLLTEVAGKPALTAARATLPAVLDRCAGSPYALHAAAPRLTAPPPQENPTVPDRDPVHAAADDSYRALAPGAARLYRLAGLRDWPALDAVAAARAAGIDPAEAAAHLEKLVAARLVEHTDGGRHRFRPAVRAHAEHTAAATDSLAACSAAVTRVTGHYRDLAVGAARAALPESWRVPAADSPVTFPDRGAALAALAVEAPNLVQAVYAAEEFGDADTVVLICRALWPLQLKAGHHEALLPALRAGARTADARFPGTRAAGALHAQLAHSLTELILWDEAEAEALAAARDEEAAGHVRGHASAVEFLGLLRLRQWRYVDAHACFDEADGILDGLGPDDEGAADLPRARALLDRHRGRALRGQGRHAEATAALGRALGFFRDRREGYNTARTLTDLAEAHLDAAAGDTALPLIDEALTILADENATYHVAHLNLLRERCVALGE
jgi:tetratricopeptide (TPR) repeat protein